MRLAAHGSGSTLTNAPRDGGWCPIYGTLKGSGTLSGPYRFTGEDNCWEVTGGASTRELARVNFADPTKETFTGLKNLKVTFGGKPKKSAYYLTGVVSGLTPADVAGVTLSVSDEEGTDYTENFTLSIKDGKLVLTNAKPAGFLLIVR